MNWQNVLNISARVKRLAGTKFAAPGRLAERANLKWTAQAFILGPARLRAFCCEFNSHSYVAEQYRCYASSQKTSTVPVRVS